MYYITVEPIRGKPTLIGETEGPVDAPELSKVKFTIKLNQPEHKRNLITLLRRGAIRWVQPGEMLEYMASVFPEKYLWPMLKVRHKKDNRLLWETHYMHCQPIDFTPAQVEELDELELFFTY